MSNPKHPIITFTVNLAQDDGVEIGPKTNSRTVSTLHPDRHDNDQDRGYTNSQNHRTQYSSWLPGALVGENIVDNHDGTITAYGEKALYLDRNFTSGNNALLTVTTRTFDSE